jgi:hypothetical protein
MPLLQILADDEPPCFGKEDPLLSPSITVVVFLMQVVV